ncbi:CDP-glycerol glycerophosphotransferase family protein [Nocardiopsis sp. LOL_012]|uniref:CDP-glycerol glycerophosphotransferase family protein n=1 Tax=Nocardiopsis sp. LOL_012 TaxID=3345409 RepID=UPI003A8B244B
MPQITVIVAFDATEPHLQDCLDSLARQDGTDPEARAEAVLVPVRQPGTGVPGTGTAHPDGDDESVESAPRDALAVARAFAAAPPPGLAVRLLDGAPCSDRSAARARGAEAATGTHLLFLDGADALTGYALAYLARAARDSRSDLVVGGAHRFNELGASPSRAHRAYGARPRTAEDPRHVPGLLTDPALGNRLWRGEFWDALPDHGLHPDDVDLALRRAALSAHTVDYLPAPVLLIRERDADPAVPDADLLARRLVAAGALAASLAATDRDLWDRTLLEGELARALKHLDEAAPDVRRALVELVGTYLEHVSPETVDGLRALHRLMYHLVRRGRVDDLAELAVFARSVEIKKAPAVRRGLTYYLRYPFFESTDPDKAVPRRVYRLDDHLHARQKTEDVRWKDGRLHISGRIGLPHLPARKRWQQYVTAHAVDTRGARRVRLPVRVRRAAEYRLPDVPEAARHDWGGFTVVLDPARLRTGGRWETGEWTVEMTVFNRGLVRHKTLSHPVPGPPERPGCHEAAEDLWIRPRWDAARRLVVAVEPVRARITGHGHDADTGVLELRGELLGDPEATQGEIRLTRAPGTAETVHPATVADGRFTARVDTRALFDRAVDECGGAILQEEWEALLVLDGTEAVPLVLPDGVAATAYALRDARRELAVQRTPTGHVRLRAGRARPIVDSARWEGRDLVLEGEFGAATELWIVARARGRDEEHVFDTRQDGHRFTARLSPADTATLSGPLSLPAGSYRLWGRTTGAGPVQPVDAGVEYGEDLIAEPPIAMSTDQRDYTLTYQGRGIPVLTVGSDLRPAERGTFAQRGLRETDYPRWRGEPLTEGVLFDSYTGRQYSDSPQSICARLRTDDRWEHYPMSWLVADGQVNLPEGLAPVRLKGREYYEALARTRYLVTNSRQPAWFHKRPDQVVVQTWHGSMLKRIGFDVENVGGKSRDYFDKLAWETRQWDYLVSPSPWATPILRSAFRFEGEILETGYPRNDIFFSPDRDRIAARVRRHLGLPEGKKVVLYAPTWRDDKYYTRGKHKLDLHLDLQRMYDKLGDDHVLLVRRHPRVVDSVPVVGEGFVHDVSLYPEIMELFLITDVLITDYSSMMFDFANTGRPMLFFTYDLESYRDRLRGFYFDFEQTAPGPLLTESDQVIEALLDIDETAARHADGYRAFVERFCPLDDGHAAARVVDRVFGSS